MRILHVLYGMNRGGIETWLMHVLRHIDRKRFHMDFLVFTTKSCAYDKEIFSLGSKIIPCLYPHIPWLFAYNLRQAIRSHGPYDVIHSHIKYYSGYILRLAYKLGIPIRIAHSHSNTPLLKSNILNRKYLETMKNWIKCYATCGLAVSKKAARYLFGADWESDPRWYIFYNGTDLDAFKAVQNPSIIRTELQIPPGAFVIGHVGNFSKIKNHKFLIEVINELVKEDQNLRVLLVGDGPMRSIIEQKVNEMGLSQYIMFMGLRCDVPRLMTGAMDLLILPSFSEGLPLVLIEAQAAGLPCVISDNITEDVDIVKDMIFRLPITASADIWAREILKLRNKKSFINQEKILQIIENSPVNIVSNVKRLERFYSY